MAHRNPILIALEEDLTKARQRQEQAEREIAVIEDQIKRFTPLVRRKTRAQKAPPTVAVAS